MQRIVKRMNEKSKSLIFRINDNGHGPTLLRDVFLEAGWIEFDEHEREDNDWNLWWKTSRFKNSDYDQLQPWQRLNHYPRSIAITRKDSLARNMRRMKAVYGASTYNFSPDAFNLPNDYTRFVSEYSKFREKYPSRVQYWICKPADLSRGRGIFVFKDLSELQYDSNAVVQQYITKPLLISGYKFDIRIYVTVNSFHPLNIYIYKEGLVRFSTEKYDLSCLGNTFSHLTNTSINKHGPSYTSDKERVGSGCKWTLSQLRNYLQQVNIDDKALFAQIINIIILTIIIQAQQVPKADNCFEMFGFDVIIDENLKPWLLEVNFSPALSSDCHVDILVKKPLLCDLVNMLKFTEADKARGRAKPKKNDGNQKKSSASSFESKSSGNLRHRRSSSKRLGSCSDSSGAEWASEDGSHLGGCDSEMVQTVLPGCGLPSVQHPQPPSPNPVRSRSERQRKLSRRDSHTRSHSVTGSEAYEDKPLKLTRKFSDNSLPSYIKGSVSRSPNAGTSILQGVKRISPINRSPNLYNQWANSQYDDTTDDKDELGPTFKPKHQPSQSPNLLNGKPPLLNKRHQIPPATSDHHKAKPRLRTIRPRRNSLAKEVGGFVRVFPFGDSSYTNMNDNDAVKHAVRECAQYVRIVTSISQSCHGKPGMFKEALQKSLQSKLLPEFPTLWLT